MTACASFLKKIVRKVEQRERFSKVVSEGVKELLDFHSIAPLVLSTN